MLKVLKTKTMETVANFAVIAYKNYTKICHPYWII